MGQDFRVLGVANVLISLKHLAVLNLSRFLIGILSLVPNWLHV